MITKMRHASAVVVLLGAFALLGCDGQTGPSDAFGLALTLSPTTIHVVGEDEAVVTLSMDLVGIIPPLLKVPVCPGPSGPFAVIGREQLVEGEWSLGWVTSKCDYETVEETRPAEVVPGEAFIRTGAPNVAGTYRYWTVVELPSGDRVKVYTPELSVLP